MLWENVVSGKLNDAHIEALISEAREYSKAAREIPTPPPVVYPRFPEDADESQLLEQRGRPSWFEPVEHPDGPGLHVDGLMGELPVIDTPGEILDPSEEDERQIEHNGIEALAYYAPFHFYSRTQWGIYIRDYGVAYLASQFLQRRKLTSADNLVIRCAYWLLFYHEYFHFQTEIAATNYELLTDDQKAYEKVFHDAHAHWLEESIANANAYRELSEGKDVQLTFSLIQQLKGFVSSWMKTQPPGYRDFDRWCKTKATMEKGKSELTRRLHRVSNNTSLNIFGAGEHLSVSVGMRIASRDVVDPSILRPFDKSDYSMIPVTRIHDSGIPLLKSAQLFPKSFGLQLLVYTREHPPAHIHVEFPGEDNSVRLGWPSLGSLPGERHLSGSEKKNLKSYLQAHHHDVWQKVQKTFGQLPPAALASI
jgi:hypothetical protein